MRSPIIPLSGIILLVHLLIERTQCKVTFYHPNLVPHYLHLRRSSANNNTTSTPFLSKSEVIDVNSLCGMVVQNDNFVILKSDDPMHTSFSRVIEDVFKKSNISLAMNSDSTIADETIDVPGIVGGVNVIRCATVNGRSLYIENETHNHEYFVFKGTEDEQRYKIELFSFSPTIRWSIGRDRMRLTKPTTFSFQIFNRLQELENEFITSQIKILGREKRNICLLQGMDRLKVCSMVYQLQVGPSIPELQGIKQYYIREKSTYDDCKPDVHVKFLNPENEVAFKISDDHHTVDLVPCAVNSEWKTPTFYVAANQSSTRGAFVFSSLVGKPDQYVVIMHLRDVYLLQKYPPFMP